MAAGGRHPRRVRHRGRRAGAVGPPQPGPGRRARRRRPRERLRRPFICRRRHGRPPRRRRRRPHHPARWSACRCRAAPSTASTRSTPRSRCPRASRWPPSPSTASMNAALLVVADAGHHRRRPGRPSWSPTARREPPADLRRSAGARPVEPASLGRGHAGRRRRDALGGRQRGGGLGPSPTCEALAHRRACRVGRPPARRWRARPRLACDAGRRSSRPAAGPFGALRLERSARLRRRSVWRRGVAPALRHARGAAGRSRRSTAACFGPNEYTRHAAQNGAAVAARSCEASNRACSIARPCRSWPYLGQLLLACRHGIGCDRGSVAPVGRSGSEAASMSTSRPVLDRSAAGAD